MKRIILTLISCCLLTTVRAQLSWSVVTSAGLTDAEDYKWYDDKDGGLYGLGADVAYDFGGRVGQISLGLAYERYRDFAFNRNFSAGSELNHPNERGDYIHYRNSIEGWKAVRLNLGVEGPFFVLPDDSPLRMFVNGGIALTAGVQQFGAQLILPDSTGNVPRETVEYTTYGERVTDGRRESTINRINLFAGFGLAYRLNSTLTVSAAYEKSIGRVGREYEWVYVDSSSGREESLRNHYAGSIQNFRIGLAVSVF